jgi:pimeloyl-ACP methyl ester carboxylesterase
VGDEDTLTPLAEAESLRAGIRGAQLQVIEGAGHLSNLEQPERFNSVLIDFINSLKES